MSAHALKTDNERVAPSPFDPDDPELTRFQLVQEGARRDGVEIVHYAPRFPTKGSRRERRIERAIAFFLLFSGLASLVFLVVYIWWPWKYEPGHVQAKWYTPLLGLSLGLALVCIGIAVITFAKKLLPEEIAVQSRHDQDVDLTERKLTGAALANMGAEFGMSRRPLLKFAIPLGLAPIGLVAAAPIVGGLIKNPHNPDIYFTTGFNPSNNGGNPVPLVREDMTPIRPEDVSAGGQMTVFPGIPGGATNQYADSPTLLIHLRPDDAATLRANLAHVPLNARDGGAMWGDYVAYSKICTHAGCPASLYEQQTNRLLCPCHQSQFNILDNARPIFGPATRRLPMLPITVENGYFVAKSDYTSPIGPGFWERP